MRSLRLALTLAAVVCLSAVLAVGVAGVPACARQAVDEAATENGSDRETFVGTYRLVTTEVKDANGTWSQEPNFNRIGYITYSDTGYMGVTTMAKNRTRFAGDQPTPEEAQVVLGGDYRGYYGPYTVNEEESFVVHHRAGQIDPGGEVDAKRFYDLVGDQLILTPAARHRWQRAGHAPHRVGAAAGRAALGPKRRGLLAFVNWCTRTATLKKMAAS